MTALTRPWRAFLSLFAFRASRADDANWVEPWNAITLAVLYGDPARFETQAVVYVPATATTVGPAMAPAPAINALPEPAERDYFVESATEFETDVEEVATAPDDQTARPKHEERAA